ncbi:MAG: hypothetical protein J0M12_04040 [Deltaproteobacteria bacterium]|nr:hypothetical protein [Deltaproteobacteria bacterium]
MSHSKLWETVDGIVKAEGLELFDIEVPSGNAGTLKVFISRSAGREESESESEAKSSGVQLHHCTAVAKKILDLENIEQLLPGEHLIEVSSPGINRKLSRPEHFRGAIGERVRLKIRGNDGKNRVVFGTLRACTADTLSFEEEGTQAAQEVALSEVQQARVDFVFE